MCGTPLATTLVTLPVIPGHGIITTASPEPAAPRKLQPFLQEMARAAKHSQLRAPLQDLWMAELSATKPTQAFPATAQALLTQPTRPQFKVWLWVGSRAWRSPPTAQPVNPPAMP